MNKLGARFRAYTGSLAGRMTMLLTVGMAAAAILSLFAAEQARKYDFARVRIERAADSAVDIAKRLSLNPEGTVRLLGANQIWGARLAAPGLQVTKPEYPLTNILEQRLGMAAHAVGYEMPSESCYSRDPVGLSQRAAGIVELPTMDCWLVQFQDANGVARVLTINLPRFVVPPSSTLSPVYLLIILVASALLSFLVARLTTAPLRRLAEASHAFSLSLDPEPIPERGPSEVRTALMTFNLMQKRVRDGFRERTHILAAIAHDLQTPLTRLRLRLEQVQDEVLRDRLISDLSATQSLVRDGLSLARSSETRESWSVVDLDSLLASLAEDASELGANVHFTMECGHSARVKPDALTRCLTNLIDNALKYAGDAELGCEHDGTRLVISVRDHGPGLPEERMEEMFEPFVRGDSSRSRSTGGTGIGLTIARAQAQTFGGIVKLENHSDGGLVARIFLAGRPH